MKPKMMRELYYITHINNIPSILKLGILSHEQVEREPLQYTPIYDKQIIANRRERKTPDGKSLWSFANLYFQPRNPMLYRVICEKPIEDIAIISVRQDILNRTGVFVSTGNAASAASEILPLGSDRRVLYQIRDSVSQVWWTEESGLKRKIMAECLVPDEVPEEFIQTIYVASYDVAEKLKEILQLPNIPIVSEPNLFFQPIRRPQLTQYLSLVEGDLFFSRMQTLTVSVNTVGVMGKGLASRAKYQFPDVYVLYQDLCRNRILRMGKPFLYKRETSFDYQLADEPGTLTCANSETWFLLFPTKHDWRNLADIQGIEEGLRWLRDNFKKEAIESLAIPALGCGLGRLDWHDVGPLMCRYLSSFDIPVWLYLPAEKKVPDELVTREFLLG